MKLIKPSFLIKEQEPGLLGIYRQIEYAGRICYKSSDKITEDSAKTFVDRMIKSGHGAMLEHGTIYLGRPVFPDIGLDGEYSYETDGFYKKYIDNKFSHVEVRPFKWSGEDGCYVTTNLRVLVENNWLDDLQYICEPTEFHEKRITVHFTTQIAITREYNRHRVNSMAEQSTRYCNYGKDKFGGVGINLPSWVDSEIQRLEDITKNVLPTFEQLKEEYFSVSDQGITKDDWGDIEWWLWSNLVAEESYLKLIEKGRKPQEARVVLPLDTNTELIHTAFVSDWNHFFRLRSRIAETGKPHPQAQELADSLMDEFIKRGITELVE
jgi:thymidylate synthase (FAD)